MFWPDTQTGVDVEPARKTVQSAVRKYFTEGGVGVPPTVPGGDWFNQITNELLNVLAAANIDPSKVDDDQLLEAIKRVSNSTSAREALRRSYAEAGYTLVEGSFEEGGVLSVASDVMITASGDGYSWGGPEFPHNVAAGTDPTLPSSGYVPRTDVVLRDELAASTGAEIIGTAEGITLAGKLSNLDTVKYKKCADYKGRCGYLDGAFGIECWGDSTMWGSISNNAAVQEAENPAVVLDKVLYSIYMGHNPTVVNRAIPGTSLNSMINGLHLYPNTFDYEMSVSTASIIYCNHCHNDCYSGVSTPAEFKDNVIKFVEICRKYGKTPVLVTPNITNYSVTVSGVSTVRYGAYIDEIRDVAKAMDVDIVDIYKYTANTARSVSLMDIVPDGGHPSTKGYQYIGATLALPLITPVLLSSVGDAGCITSTTYFDNITNDRQFVNSANRLGKNLGGTSDSSVQRVNIPILLEHPTDTSFVAINYQTSGVGASAQFLHNGQFRADFSGIIDYLASTPSVDNVAAGACDLWAGVSLVGVIASTSLLTPAGNFNISGVNLLERCKIIIPTPWQGALHKNDRPIIAGDTIEFIASVDATAAIQTLCQLATNSGNIPWLTVKSELGVIKATTPNSTTTIGTASTEVYGAKIEFLSNYDIKVTVGGLSAQLPALSEAIPNSHLDYPTSKSHSYFVGR